MFKHLIPRRIFQIIKLLGESSCTNNINIDVLWTHLNLVANQQKKMVFWHCHGARFNHHTFTNFRVIQESLVLHKVLIPIRWTKIKLPKCKQYDLEITNCCLLYHFNGYNKSGYRNNHSWLIILLARNISQKSTFLPMMCCKIKVTMIDSCSRKPCKMHCSSLLNEKMQLTAQREHHCSLLRKDILAQTY